MRCRHGIHRPEHLEILVGPARVVDQEVDRIRNLGLGSRSAQTNRLKNSLKTRRPSLQHLRRTVKDLSLEISEPMGVVAFVAGEKRPLLDLVAGIAPIIVGGNAVVALSTGRAAVAAMELGEVLETSDLPGGVVNLLCGLRSELITQIAGHMDVNALVVQGGDAKEIASLREACALNLKRFFVRPDKAKGDEDPYRILDTVEIKTTWHPVGG